MCNKREEDVRRKPREISLTRWYYFSEWCAVWWCRGWGRRCPDNRTNCERCGKEDSDNAQLNDLTHYWKAIRSFSFSSSTANVEHNLMITVGNAFQMIYQCVNEEWCCWGNCHKVERPLYICMRVVFGAKIFQKFSRDLKEVNWIPPAIRIFEWFPFECVALDWLLENRHS